MDQLIYLDNAATTFPKPKEVYDFMHEFYQTNGVNPGRSGYDMTIETEEVVHGTRKMLTKFFNGDDPNRLTFSYNASDSLNMIIHLSLHAFIIWWDRQVFYIPARIAAFLTHILLFWLDPPMPVY